jgi:hypothetical protein
MEDINTTNLQTEYEAVGGERGKRATSLKMRHFRIPGDTAENSWRADERNE